jgi:hypothetical protein
MTNVSRTYIFLHKGQLGHLPHITFGVGSFFGFDLHCITSFKTHRGILLHLWNDDSILSHISTNTIQLVDLQ